MASSGPVDPGRGQFSGDGPSDRFRLPSGRLEQGRSQPKRTPPKKNVPEPQILKRIALGVATFLVALGTVALLNGLFISADFRDLTYENAPTAAISLLIGYFSLNPGARRTIRPQINLLVCLIVLGFTPWTYQLGNQKEAAGMDLATGFNFMFEVALAVLAGLLPRQSH
jgi:hypothetical protein